MFKMVLLDLKCLKCRISFCIKHFTRSVVYNIFVATYLLRPPSKHRQRCLASAERKVVPPRVRGPLPPLLWVSGWNNPLRNFCVPPPRQRSRSSRAFSRFVLLSGTAEPGTCPPPLLHHVCLYSSSLSLSQFQSTESTLLNMSDEEETDYSQTEGESEQSEEEVEDDVDDEEDQTEPESEEVEVERPHSPDTCRLRCRTRCRFPVNRPRS